MFLLQVTPPEGPPFARGVDAETLVVGRSPDCDLLLPDPFLSRFHARFYRRDDDLWVEDLGSSNGTVVNGDRIDAATRLAVGDEVRLSDTRITVARPAAEGRDVRAELPGDAGLTALKPVSELLADHDPSTLDRRGDQLARYTARLRLLNDLHRELGRSIALGEVLELVLDGAFEHLQPEEALVFLLPEKDGEVDEENGEENDDDAPDDLVLAAARPPDAKGLVSATLRREVMDKGQAALALDVRSDERFSDAASIMASAARGLLAAPLQDADGCLGMVVLFSRLQKHSFAEDDLELLASIAAAAALRVRNLRLARAAAERERLEGELRLARRIQVSLLPRTIPQPEGYRLHAANTPSRTVSGDYYQIIQRNDGAETAVLIADVCGKGTAAALLTASLEAVCSSLLEAGGAAPDVLSHACHFLHQRTPPGKFATACLALLDGASGRVSFVNAGHNPPLLVRAGGGVEELAASGFPLGMVPRSDYDESVLELAPGDLLFLFTDGIVEAEDPDGAQYGLERLTALVVEHRGDTPQELAAALEADLGAFAAGTPRGDDQTFVILQRG